MFMVKMQSNTESNICFYRLFNLCMYNVLNLIPKIPDVNKESLFWRRLASFIPPLLVAPFSPAFTV